MLKFKKTNIIRIYLRKYTQTGNKNFDHCMNLVKNHDYENYLSTMLLPKTILRSAFAIRAFNIEMSNISALSRDPKISLMRFKFWKDRLNSMYTEVNFNTSDEPVTTELLISIRKHELSKNWLNRLIESRESQLLNKISYQTIKDVELHGEKSVASIYYLLLECLKIKNLNCDHVASHISKSYILVNLVRSIPQQSKQNISLIPIELLVKHQISQNEIIKMTNNNKNKIENEKLKDLIYDLCNLSNQHLMKARKLSSLIPSNLNILFINSIIIESFLKKIEKHNFDINNQLLHQREAFLPFKLYLAKWKNKY